MLVLLPHVFNDYVAEVHIGDVWIALLIELRPNVGQTTAKDHDLVLLVVIQPTLDDLLDLLIVEIPLLL